MGAGKYENKHGVGLLLNKKWRKRINDTEHLNELAITTTIMVNHHRIKLMSVYFHNSLTIILRKCTEQSRSTRIPVRRAIQIVGGDFNAELGPGYGVERVSVGSHTLKEENERGDWMKQWLMYRKTFGKQPTYRSLEGTEKHIDYIFSRADT